jgi:hypothetical protein
LASESFEGGWRWLEADDAIAVAETSELAAVLTLEPTDVDDNRYCEPLEQSLQVSFSCVETRP